MTTWLPLALIFYLWGSINHAVVIGRLAKKGDIRSRGSGNPGAFNALRVMGKGWAVVVLLLDVGRGLICAWLARRWLTMDWVAWSASMAVLAGNLFPVFHGFRGGKGVATSLGLVLGFQPLSAACGVVIYTLLLLAFRISSVGSLCMLASFPLSMWLLDNSVVDVGFSSALSLIAFLTHRSNLQRLWSGGEARLGKRQQKSRV